MTNICMGLTGTKNVLPYFFKILKNGTFLHGCCSEMVVAKTKQTKTKKSKHNF